MWKTTTIWPAAPVSPPRGETDSAGADLFAQRLGNRGRGDRALTENNGFVAGEVDDRRWDRVAGGAAVQVDRHRLAQLLLRLRGGGRRLAAGDVGRRHGHRADLAEEFDRD